MSSKPKTGAPGTTEQSPRWEGPPENRPRGYLPPLDDPYRDEDAMGETEADGETSDKRSERDRGASGGEEP